MQRTSSDFSAVAAASERAALLCTSSLMASPVQPWLGSVLYHTAARVPLPFRSSFSFFVNRRLSLSLPLAPSFSLPIPLSLCIYPSLSFALCLTSHSCVLALTLLFSSLLAPLNPLFTRPLLLLLLLLLFAHTRH